MVSYRNQDLIHCDPEEIAERVEIVYRRKALASLPLVDCLGLFETEVLLKVPGGEPSLDTKASDVFPRCGEIDNGVLYQVQKHHPGVLPISCSLSFSAV